MIRTGLVFGVGLCLVALAGLASGQDRATPEPVAAPSLAEEAEAAARSDRSHRDAVKAREAEDRARRDALQEATIAAERAKQRDEARELERALTEAQALQDELAREHRQPGIRQEARAGAAPPLPLEGRGWDHDPRVAAAAPELRELPTDIFDTSREVVPPETWQNREPVRVIRLELDADGDSKPELIRFLDAVTRELLREEADRNYDGVLDAWTMYRDQSPSSRVLDENDDGNPDVFESYRDGVLVVRELDRDDDGVRDVFYRYRGDSLAEESHDANNDGAVDLVIHYAKRQRVRAEEDVDRDGRMDLWTRYAGGSSGEEVVQIEHDQAGRGFADTFEYFAKQGGKTLLVRREHDIDGDGQVDVVSFYIEGRLSRRQIADADQVPL
ncbi:MAG: hypothetical protein P8Q97_10870 [Myxococcota bacterium]|jgi:hypothetical protein|nr:hypothetical protein [Myxococcota bacterium]